MTNNPPPVQGFIKYHGKIVAALKIGKRVAMYQGPDDEGRWVGSTVAATFHAKPWGRSEDWEKFEAEIHRIDEFNRLMPEQDAWGRRDKQYDCLMCGAIVHDRNVHMTWHHHQDERLLATVTALWGPDAH